MKWAGLLLGFMALIFFGQAVAGETETEAENLAVVKQVYADFAAGDMESFTALLAPDIVWNEAENNELADGNPYIGVDAIMSGIMGRLGADYDSFAVAPESFMADGDEVVMFGRYKAKYKSTGKSMNPQVVHHYTMKDGKVIAFQQYVDTLALKEAATPDVDEAALGEELLTNYLTAINSGETDQPLQLMSDNVVFQYPGAPELIGKDAVQDWAQGYYDAIDSDWVKTSLAFHVAGDWAMERYSYSVTETNKATGDVSSDVGKGILVYKKNEDGKWLVTWDGWSSDQQEGE